MKLARLTAILFAILTAAGAAPTAAAQDPAKTSWAETTPLEKVAKEYKLYAPGVGLIKDASLLLVEFGHLEKK